MHFSSVWTLLEISSDKWLLASAKDTLIAIYLLLPLSKRLQATQYYGHNDYIDYEILYRRVDVHKASKAIAVSLVQSRRTPGSALTRDRGTQKQLHPRRLGSGVLQLLQHRGLSRSAENDLADSIDMLYKILIPDCFVVDYIYKIWKRRFIV